MNVFSKVRSSVASCLNDLLRLGGVEIKTCSALPQHNLLGLRHVPFQTVLDIGANEGQFAGKALSLFPAAQFYSFEPIPRCFESLQQKCQQSERWTCYNLALAEAEKTTILNIHEDNMPSSSLLHATPEELDLYPKSKRQSEFEVRCTTLDKWVSLRAGALRRPSLLKLDVQGYELNVLKGGCLALIEVDAVICEINIRKFYEEQASFADIVNFLHTRSIHFHGVLEHTYDDAYNVIAFDAIFRRHVLP